MKDTANISRTRSSLVMGAFVAVVVILSTALGWFDRPDMMAYDLSLRVPQTRNRDPQVVVIGISRRDLEDPEIGKNPSRGVYARTLEILFDRSGPAAAVGFDFHFPSPRSDDEEGDRKFAEALARFPKAVLPVFTPDNLRGYRQLFESDNDPADAAREGIGFRGRKYVLSPDHLRGSFSLLSDAAHAVAHINVVPDVDALVRRLPAVIAEESGDTEYLPLAAEVLRLARGIPKKWCRIQDDMLELGFVSVPVSEEGLIHINPLDFEEAIADSTRDGSAFQLDERPIAYYELSSLYYDRIPRERLAGRLVFIGRTKHGRDADIHPTPFGARFGVFLHAMFARALIDHRFVADFHEHPALKYVVLAVLSFVAAYVFFRLPPKAQIPVFIACVSVVVYVFLALFHCMFPFAALKHGTFVSPVACIAVLATNFGIGLAFNLSVAERQIRVKNLELDLLDEAGRLVTQQIDDHRYELAHLGMSADVAANMGVDVELSKAIPSGLATVIGRAIGAEGCVILQKREDDGGFEAVGTFWEGPSFDTDKAAALLDRRGEKLSSLTQTLTPAEMEEEDLALDGLSSLLIVPLKLGSETAGILAVFNKRASDISPRSYLTDDDLRVLSTLSSEAALTLENMRLLNNVRRLFGDSIRALAQAVDAKDPYTHGHSERVKDYAVAIAQELGFTPNECLLVDLAAVLHDIGKIGIPETVLNKPGSLTREEYTVVQGHPAKGAEIIRAVRELAPIVPSIRGHHERWDGKGYPDGIRGEEIPRIAQVIGVADAFDAMTYARVYRGARSFEEATREITELRGTQFAPAPADAFVAYLRKIHGIAVE